MPIGRASKIAILMIDPHNTVVRFSPVVSVVVICECEILLQFENHLSLFYDIADCFQRYEVHMYKII